MKFAYFLESEPCVFCGTLTASGYPVCDPCVRERMYERSRKAIGGANADRCTQCGRILVSCDDLCMDCKSPGRFSAIDSIMPLFAYTPAHQELLTLWKIDGRRSLTPLFARLLHSCISESGLTDWTVVPVPPRPGKIRDKGWDQMEDIARYLGLSLGMKLSRCLVRSVSGEQKKLGRAGRKLNLKGKLSLKHGVNPPEKILLIDDLMTTGSTLDACAEALKCGGSKTVYGLTLFFD